MAKGGDIHQLRVPPGHQQRKEGEGRRIGFQERRQQMTLQMMYRDGSGAPGIRQAPGKAGPDQQRTDQAGPGGIGHPVDLARLGARSLECLAYQGQEAFHMVSGCQLRHHPPIGLMQADLAVQAVR